MAFPFYSQWDTSTSSNWPGVYYVQNAVRAFQAPVISAAAQARIALARVRSFWWQPPPLAVAAQVEGGAHAHRRAIPSRGVVSWVRAGTRRPLRARRA